MHDLGGSPFPTAVVLVGSPELAHAYPVTHAENQVHPLSPGTKVLAPLWDASVSSISPPKGCFREREVP